MHKETAVACVRIVEDGEVSRWQTPFAALPSMRNLAAEVGHKEQSMSEGLAPMQDGRFQHGQLNHSIGKCVFVFAGGTSLSFGGV